jgi:hypothetical protein
VTPKAATTVDARPRETLRQLFASWGHCSPAADADDAIQALIDAGWSLALGAPEPGVYNLDPWEHESWTLSPR